MGDGGDDRTVRQRAVGGQAEPVGTRAALCTLRERMSPLRENRPLTADVEIVCGMIDASAPIAAISKLGD